MDARGTGCHERAAAAINEWEVAEGGKGRVLPLPDEEKAEPMSRANIIASLKVLAHRVDEHNPDARYVPLGTAIQAVEEASGLASGESVPAALILSPEFARKVAVSLSVAGRSWTEADVQDAIREALTDA